MVWSLVYADELTLVYLAENDSCGDGKGKGEDWGLRGGEIPTGGEYLGAQCVHGEALLVKISAEC